MVTTSSSKLRIGVIAPSSNLIPFLSADMLAAFEFGLRQADAEAEIIIESAGFNADLKMLIPAVQQLILARRVNCIVAPLNVSIIEKISGHCAGNNVPLIALNLTEDPLFDSVENPFVFVSSFRLWHSAWMSGYLAGRRFGQRAAAIVAMHEGGYGLMFAFQLGLEAAGGTLIRAAVTHRKSSNEDPTATIDEVIAQNPDFIWSAHSGKEAVSFLEAYQAIGGKEKIPLITLSPMLTQNIRRDADDTTHKIWHLTSEYADSKLSMTALTDAVGREPNPYVPLAYESARLIADAIGKTKNSEDPFADFSESLRQSEYKSLERTIRFNDNLSDNERFYLRRIYDGTDETIEEVYAPPLLDEQYRLACKKLSKEGWINPYLCA